MSYFSDSTVCTLFVLILIVGFFMGLATGHSIDPTVMDDLNSLEDEFARKTFDNRSFGELSYLNGEYDSLMKLVVELRVHNYLQLKQMRVDGYMIGEWI